MSTAYHPQSDGQTERANRTVEDMLRGFVGPKQRDWSRFLGMAEFAYNNSKQASSQHSPFFLNHGRHPSTPFSNIVPNRAQVPAVTTFVEGLQSALQDAKTNINAAQMRQKAYADKRRREHRFQMGEQVLLAVRQQQLPPGISSKLSVTYSGPFLISAAVGKNAFRLDLPATVNIHPVFHVSQLKPFVADDNLHPAQLATQPVPVYADKRGAVFEVESILGKRQKKIGSTRTWEYLVRWKGYPAWECTWEPFSHVKHLKADCQAASTLTLGDIHRLTSSP
jgi:hypothetical protein